MYLTLSTFSTVKSKIARAACIAFAVGIGVLGALAPAKTQAAGIELVGLNLSGAGFGPGALPGKNGTNYFFPTENYFQQWRSKGIRLIRFPIIWERLQPTLGGPLDPTYAGLIDQTFRFADQYDMQIILDLHNYMRYRGEVIGTGNVTYAHFRDVNLKIAQRWGGVKSLYAYDIMNEPHDATAQWPIAAQHGIDGIRVMDNVRPIMIEGNGWANATIWPQWNASLLNLKDPADNLIFQAHVYFDGVYGGGSYKSFDVATVSADYGVERVKPFVEWLKKYNKKGFIGEYGVPADEPRWLPIMDGMLAYLRDNCIPSTYWAAGPGWANYRLAVEPINGVDRPQWPTLKKYINNTRCWAIGPFSTPQSQPPVTGTNPSNSGPGSNTQPTGSTSSPRPAWKEAAPSVAHANAQAAAYPSAVPGTSDAMSTAATKSSAIVEYAAGNAPIVARPAMQAVYVADATATDRAVGTLQGQTQMAGPVVRSPSGSSASASHQFTARPATASVSVSAPPPTPVMPTAHSSDSALPSAAPGSLSTGTGSGSTDNSQNAAVPSGKSPKSMPSKADVGIAAVTDGTWNAGIHRTANAFLIPKTSANLSVFKTGASVKLSDGQVAKIGFVNNIGGNMAVYLQGGSLKSGPSGFPRSVTPFSQATR
ncbi:cellulase family glycosylhydrolase [Pseudomonas sp. Marseille-QA0892]